MPKHNEQPTAFFATPTTTTTPTKASQEKENVSSQLQEGGEVGGGEADGPLKYCLSIDQSG